MFGTKKVQDIKKSISKIQDIKKESSARLKHLKAILDYVDIEEAKSIFDTNYSHVYYILYDTFVQAESNLKQRVHKAHREELDGSLWLLEKVLLLLPELLSKRWQVQSLSRILSKLTHQGNGSKLRRDGVRYFLMWYQALGENAPQMVHSMFNELVPGLSVPQKNYSGPSDTEFHSHDILSHPNMKITSDVGASVFHDTTSNSHPVMPPDIGPLLPPTSSSDKTTAAPNPRDGLEVLLECITQASGVLRWRESCHQKHMRGFNFLLERFRQVYLPVFCPNFDHSYSVYDPRLDLPVMRSISKKEQTFGSCIVVLITWVAKHTHEKMNSAQVPVERAIEYGFLNSSLFTQSDLVKHVLYSSRDNINFVHEVYRQAFLLHFTSHHQIEAMRTAICIYHDWLNSSGSQMPPFLLEPNPEGPNSSGASVRAGLQNILKVFMTNTVNVFMIQTSQLDIRLTTRLREGTMTPLDKQHSVCRQVLNIYRSMVMRMNMEPKTYEQLLLVLLQVTSVILSQATPNSKENLGGRLAQQIFQTLIVTWVRAHTMVNVNPIMWDKFVQVLGSLTHREELINQWTKIMQTLTRVMVRQVYNLALNELPLDRMAVNTQKRRRRIGGATPSSDQSNAIFPSVSTNYATPMKPTEIQSRPGVESTPGLNRSYSEGSLASARKSSRFRRYRRARRNNENIISLPPNVETSISKILSLSTATSLETLNSSVSQVTSSYQGMRRAVSLNSIRVEENCRSSTSPSPSTSLGGSAKGLQIDSIQDNSSLDDDPLSSIDKRSIMSGGTVKGWQPDVAAVMWKRMLGALGDVNKILNPKLHAQVFEELTHITEDLLKVRLNQGISLDNTSTPPPPTLVPPISLITPWCYGALALDSMYQTGKLYAMQTLCMIVRQGVSLGKDQLPLFYAALHQALTGEDRAMVFTVLKCLGGGRFLSLLLPGHSLLLLDFVHASTVVINSKDLDSKVPRAEVACLLGSLLCFPKTSLPGPVLQPSEPSIELMECPDLQEHILNIILRCARREPSAKARSIAISSLGTWIIQNCQQHFINPKIGLNSRVPEAMRVILQALQHRHCTIARSAVEALRLCAEKGKVLTKASSLVPTIIGAICASLSIQHKRNPTESDKMVVTSLLLCLGEICMAVPTRVLTSPRPDTDSKEPLLLGVLRICHNISIGQFYPSSHSQWIFDSDPDFDHTIEIDDLQEPLLNESSTKANVDKCLSTICLCAKTVVTHIVTNLSHFPIGIGASRLSSMVDEQDDLTLSFNRHDSLDVTSTVLAAPNVQLFMLNSELISSFIELPTLKIPGGGITAGIVSASRQVRLLLRDINGKFCWDASILYFEENSEPSTYHTPLSAPGSAPERSPFFNDKNPTTFMSRNLMDRNFMVNNVDPMMSLVSTFPIGASQMRHFSTLRHRPPTQLPVATDIAPDLDQLDDLLQYIGHTSTECLSSPGSALNTPSASPLSAETQAITNILNQRSLEGDFLARQSMHSSNYFVAASSMSNVVHEPIDQQSEQISGSYNYSDCTDLLPFHYCRLLFSQFGLAGWERRRKTYLLNRTDKLMRELRNVDGQRCRETHKVAVIYVANGQEDKSSILSNACGSSAYEMFVSALGWEVDLETHNGFLGGLPRQGCGSTAPYYATPFLEIIYHVATRMPSNTSETVLTKTRHLGNDEVHIVWSEHYRDYRRDILPTEFCDVLIIIYPLKSGLFRVTVSRKPDVPWFGPLSNECVVGGACLASLVRATAINASRAKRMALNYYQQFYEERHRSLEVVSTRHKEPTTYEDFSSRLYMPVAPAPTSNSQGSSSLAASALLDSQRSKRSSYFYNHPEVTASARDITMHTIAAASVSLDHASPRPLRKLHHPFQTATKKKSHSTASSTTSSQYQHSHTPPESPTLATNRKVR